MEQNIKQNFLSFEKGITNTPSDVMADDNSLTDAIGLTYQEGEYKPIQKEVTSFTLNAQDEIIYVHKCANFTNYICKSSSDVLSFYNSVNHNKTIIETVVGINSITSVGSIIILATDNGIKYLIFKNGTYHLYDNIPQPKLNFNLGYGENASVKGSHYDILEVIDYRVRIVNGKQQDYNALVTGLLAKARKEASQRKRFYAPFFVRYAVRLFDNSYIYISNPVLLFPAITRNCYAQMEDINDYHTKLHIATSALMFYADYDYTEWKDIVRGVDVFVTAPTEIYNLSADHTPYNAGTKAFDMIRGRNGARGDTCIYRETSIPASTNLSFYFAPIKAYEDSDIEKQILSNTVFYKLCELPSKKETNLFYGWDDMAEYINIHTLENITNQEVLKTDDYFSRAPIYPKEVYSYNSRLNIAGLSRGFFEGYEQFMPYADDNVISRTFNSYVYIHSDSGDKIIHHQFDSPDVNTHYYYYPDPRAYRVVIMTGNTLVLDVALTEHNALNGAYYFRDLPTGAASLPSTTGTAPTPINNGETETLDSTILQSEPFNPFVIKSTGDTSVGTGQIVGICSNTKAISQGQYGQYPMFVFTTDGIYTLSVSSDGTYAASQPFSRDVCSNPKSITPIDDAVMFVSKRGLMMITDKVTCVSSMLNGKPYSDKDFNKFIDGCHIAYDYQANLLHIINTTYSYRWIYNLKSGTFARLNNGNVTIGNILNDYPDTLIQKGNDIYSFYEKPIETEDQNTYSGTLKSRPCKFGELLVLKSIRQLRHIYNIDEGSLFMRFCASNDLVHWYWLNSITGAGWKYYKFEIHLSQLKATDRYLGLEVITQPRRTDKIR